MPGRPPSTPQGVILQIGAGALVCAMLFALTSIDGNPEQEAFNRGACVLSLVVPGASLMPLMWRMKRGMVTQKDLGSAYYGSGVLFLMALILYMVLGSLILDRVL